MTLKMVLNKVLNYKSKNIYFFFKPTLLFMKLLKNIRLNNYFPVKKRETQVYTT